MDGLNLFLYCSIRLESVLFLDRDSLEDAIAATTKNDAKSKNLMGQKNSMHHLLESERDRCLSIQRLSESIKELPYSSVQVPIERLVLIPPNPDLRKQGSVTCVSCSSLGVVGMGLTDNFYILRGKSWHLLPQVSDAPRSPISAASFSQSGDSLVLGYRSGWLVIFETSDWRIVRIIKEAHQGPVIHLAVLPGSRVLSAGKDGNVYLQSCGIFNDRQLLLNGNLKVTGELRRILPLIQNSRSEGIETMGLIAVLAEKAILIVKLTPTPGLVHKDFFSESPPFIDAIWLRVGMEGLPILVAMKSTNFHVLRPVGGTDSLSFISSVTEHTPSHSIVGFPNSSVFCIIGDHRIFIYQLNSLLIPCVHGSHDLPVKSGNFYSYNQRQIGVLWSDLEVGVITVHPWCDYCKALVHQERWRDSLAALCGVVLGKIPGLFDFTVKGSQEISALVRGVMVSYAASLSRSQNPMEIAADLANAALVTDQHEFFFREISVFFKKSGPTVWNSYLATVESFIAGGLFCQIDSELLKEIILSISKKNAASGTSSPLTPLSPQGQILAIGEDEKDRITRLILNSPPSSIDCDFAIRLCADLELDLALACIHNRILLDFRSPLLTFLSAKKDTLFFYIYCVLHDIPFPAPSPYPVASHGSIELSDLIFTENIFHKLFSISPELLFASIPENLNYIEKCEKLIQNPKEPEYLRYLAKVSLARKSPFHPIKLYPDAVTVLGSGNVNDVSLLKKILPLTIADSSEAAGKVLRAIPRALVNEAVDFLKMHADLEISHESEGVIGAYLLFRSGDNEGVVGMVERELERKQHSLEWTAAICDFAISGVFTDLQKNRMWVALLRVKSTDQILRVIRDRGVLLSSIPVAFPEQEMKASEYLKTLQLRELGFVERSYLLEKVKAGVETDLGNLFFEKVNRNSAGGLIEGGICLDCREPLGGMGGEKISCFFCTHSYHQTCLPQGVCPLCNAN